MPEIERFRLPFQEQIAFHRRKLNLPSKRWDDIWQSAHDRAFIVAGASSADLLDDLRQAVDGYFARGDTLENFRRNFERIVAARGWTGWTGEGTRAGRAWRTRTIYTTNISASYAAGRWQQLTDPQLLAERPYWRYVHNDSVLHPRPLHQAWGSSGLTLRHDHPFWRTHFPPNGWGCKCRVRAVRAPGEGDATEPPAGWDTNDSKTGAPPGIDRGWAYAPGASVAEELRQYLAQKTAKLPPQLAADLQQTISAPPPVNLRKQLAATPALDQPREVHAWIEAHRTATRKSYQGATMASPEDFYRVTWEGVEYWFPDNPAPVAITGASSAITRQIEQMATAPKHPRLLKAQTRRVVMSTQANQDDPYWALRYSIPGFVSAATAGVQGTVTVYRGGAISPGSMAHEMAHNLATKKWGQPTPSPASDYQAAIASGEPPVSSYASAAPAEDFAEAVQLFYEDPARIKAIAPMRYTVIERLLRDPGYGG
jgi:hypothetical protein